MRPVTSAPGLAADEFRLAAEPRAPRLGPDALVEAKLVPPRPRAHAVSRTRLLRQLRSARARRVISIFAPPGYGKTSLLVQLATQKNGSVAWLTADDDDNDPVVFLTYFAAAIGRATPLDPGVFGAIAASAASSRAVVGRLLAAIADRAEPVLVAIDDVHRITDRACLDTLAEFITYLPEGSQIVVAGREPPALPFARWRADDWMLEIGHGDLALDEQEVAGLGHQLGLELSAEAMTQLARQTEGWPALVALAALKVRRSTVSDPPIDGVGERMITDYLRSEVLELRSESEIVFMTRTSILERLTGPLCDAVVDRQESAGLLAGLARSMLLVDEYGGSYRYHPLLREFLWRELSAREPERLAGLHRRAAVWYQAIGAVDRAVDHAFAAGDLDLAATLVGSVMSSYHWSGRRATTREWFRRLGDEVLGERPWLAVLAAWEELAAGDVTSTVHLADITDRGTFQGRPPDGTSSLESGRAMLRSAMVRRGAADALTNAARAVELEAAGSRWRDFALWTLAIARLMHGDGDGADAALADAISAARSAGNGGLCHCLLGHRALVATDRGDWDDAAALSAESDMIAAPASLEGYLSIAPARAARARLATRRGDPEAARGELARAVRLRPLLTAAAPAISVLSLLGFARAHLAVGDAPGARTLLAQASDVLRQRPDLGVLPAEVAVLRATIASLPVGLAGGASTITAAELRVLALLPYYLSFKEIGQRLGTKASTVKTHAIAIYGKLGASSRSEAVDLAVQAGLLEPFFR
jgi:LuxR family transcriptional regulator, maltose regulon positive regulatory protein